MFLDINGNKIYYEIHGDGVPLIAVHGHGVDHNIMKGFIEKYIPKANYKRIYFDLPGFGKSNPTNHITNADEMYVTIKEFIREVIGNNKYLLIGLSYGGYLIRKLIKDVPENIMGVMFVCPYINKKAEENNEIPEHKMLYNEIVDKNILESDVYRNFSEVAVFSTKKALQDFNENIYPGLIGVNKEFSENYYHYGYNFYENVDEITEPFNEPTLFILGRQDPWVYYKDLKLIMKNYSRASICVIDEAGHTVQIEKPKLVEAFLLDWLERIQRKLN